MTATTFTSRDFNQDTGKAKKASRKGPVFITERGRLTHVLLSVEEYRRITEKEANIVSLLSMSDAVDFEPSRLRNGIYRPADLS